MNFRMDTLYGFQVRRPQDVVMMSAILDGPLTWCGVPVVVNDLALQHHTAFDIKRNARRRRRAYSVHRRERSTPGAYRLADGTLVVHPEVWKALQAGVSKP